MTRVEIGMWIMSAGAFVAGIWNRIDISKIKLSVDGLRVEWGRDEKRSSYQKGVAGDQAGEDADSENLK